MAVGLRLGGRYGFGLQALNVSIPQAPRSPDPTAQPVTLLAWRSRNYAYLANYDSGLQIINFSNRKRSRGSLTPSETLTA